MSFKKTALLFAFNLLNKTMEVTREKNSVQEAKMLSGLESLEVLEKLNGDG